MASPSLVDSLSRAVVLPDSITARIVALIYIFDRPSLMSPVRMSEALILVQKCPQAFAKVFAATRV
jgi:hypothetical protein